MLMKNTPTYSYLVLNILFTSKQNIQYEHNSFWQLLWKNYDIIQIIYIHTRSKLIIWICVKQIIQIHLQKFYSYCLTH